MIHNETEKALFEAPQAEVVVFNTEDVITTSGYLGFDGGRHLFDQG